MRQELRRHLLHLLTDTPREKSSDALPRHGMVANALYTLALLAGDEQSGNEVVPTASLFSAFIEYAASWPEARLLAALLYRLAPEEELREALAATVAEREKRTAALHHTPTASVTLEAKRLTAMATVAAHLFFSAPAATVGGASGVPAITLQNNEKEKALWFLSSFHSDLAGIFFSRRGELDAARLAQDFYASETVRDSFGLLAFLHGAPPSPSRVRFRKVIDLQDLAHTPTTITPGSRVVTRQDMSNLTLALRPGPYCFFATTRIQDIYWFWEYCLSAGQ